MDSRTQNFLIAKQKAGGQAAIGFQLDNKPFEVRELVLDLTEAKLTTKPQEINFPFRSLFVREATDVLTSVRIRPISDDSFQSSVALKLNDSLEFEEPIPRASLFWDAQPSKSLTLLFFVSSVFKPGSQVSQTGGGVAIIDGSSASTSNKTIAAAGATALCAASPLRKVATIQNNTGASIWIGPTSAVDNAAGGANLGYEVPAGATIQWRNTAALYCYSVGGGFALVLEEV